MDPKVSNLLLDRRWPKVEQVVREQGGDPATDVWRKDLVVHARILARPRVEETPEGPKEARDAYVFRMEFNDYDEHGPRTYICNPEPPHETSTNMKWYPDFTSGHPFTRADFLCMPGDRRCQDAGNHPEWAKKPHYHPDAIIASLSDTLNWPTYKGRRKDDAAA